MDTQAEKQLPLGSAGLCGSVGCASDWWSGGCGFDLHWVCQPSYVDIDHEIFSTVIFSFMLIQEGYMKVSGEKMCTSSGEPLRGLCLPSKSVVR